MNEICVGRAADGRKSWNFLYNLGHHTPPGRDRLRIAHHRYNSACTRIRGKTRPYPPAGEDEDNCA